MTLADAASLLHDLRARGVDLEVVGDRLRFSPPETVAPEARQRLAACKPALLYLLRQEAFVTDAGDGEKPSVERCRSCGDPDFVRPRAGGAWRCARCRPYDLPTTQIDRWPVTERAAPFEAWARVSCYACGETARWRLLSGGPWMCRRCHPPLLAAELVETAEAAR